MFRVMFSKTVFGEDIQQGIHYTRRSMWWDWYETCGPGKASSILSLPLYAEGTLPTWYPMLISGPWHNPTLPVSLNPVVTASSWSPDQSYLSLASRSEAWLLLFVCFLSLLPCLAGRLPCLSIKCPNRRAHHLGGKGKLWQDSAGRESVEAPGGRFPRLACFSWAL